MLCDWNLYARRRELNPYNLLSHLTHTEPSWPDNRSTVEGLYHFPSHSALRGGPIMEVGASQGARVQTGPGLECA